MSKETFISKRITEIPAHPIQKINEQAREMERSGEEVIHLEFGEPDFNTPRFIIEAAYKAMKAGYTKYTSGMGLIQLREAISKKIWADCGVEVDPASEIVVLPGTKHAIYCALMATVNPGDEVIITDPCYPPYEFAIKLVEGIPVRVPLKESLDFRLDPKELESKVTPKTKMILLNFPNNPTGSILTKEAIEALSEIVQRRNILVLSDEIYENLIYNGEKFHSIISSSEMRDQTILVNGFSKTYAMTGWRLGYAVAPKVIAEKIRKVQENTTTCAPSFCQIAGVEALKKGRQFVNNMVREFNHRRQVLVHGLNKIRGVSCSMPKGAFYAFPNITELGVDDNKLSECLLKEAKVATVPGSAFGNQGHGHLRISYANSVENINKALEQIREAVEKL